MIKYILDNLNKFDTTFGWYSTGVRKFNKKRGKYEGQYSDLFLLHQRCIYHEIEDLSPIVLGERNNTPYLKDNEKKHIDLYKIYSKEIIKNGVFNKKYRTDKLEDDGQSLLGIGKYTYIDPVPRTKIIVDGENVNDLPFDIQMRYVARDAELTMLLACYNDCLALEIMKYIALYSEMDYYRCCHTGVSQWYSNIYKNMIKRRECIFEYNQSKKIPKLYIAGGNSVQPKKGFYKNQPVDELDVKGMYPTIAIEHNISFETVNCQCCRNDTDSQVPTEVMDEINNSLLELKKETRTKPYWICRRIKGAFPAKLQGLIHERDKYQTLLKEENDKPKEKRDSDKIIQYNARQTALKLLANAGYGVFAREDFDFSDYRVSELITGYGRLIHKQLQQIAAQNYGLETIFGFTDSIFIKNASIEAINELIIECKNKFHVTLERKNRYMSTIVFNKKNRFIAWTGNQADKPILKNLDGTSGRYPKWLKQNIEMIATHIVINSCSSEDQGIIKSLVDKAFFELKSGKVKLEDLFFIARLSKEPEEYENENDRMKVLARQIGAHKGDLVYWYETLAEENDDMKSTRKHTSYSIKPENLNLTKYKSLLLSKLKDILEITGINVMDSELQSVSGSNTLTCADTNNESTTCRVANFNILSQIRCKYEMMSRGIQTYIVIPVWNATAVLYVTQNSPQFISGHIRVRGREGGSYPYRYLEMINEIFGKEDNTIEVCSGNVKKYNRDDGSFGVDINPMTNADLVADGQMLSPIPNNRFNRWRCDPPYNAETAMKMYGTELPKTSKLLEAGTRVCRPGSLMFLLLGPQNYQKCPRGVMRIGFIPMTVIPNNELRALNIFYKYADK